MDHQTVDDSGKGGWDRQKSGDEENKMHGQNKMISSTTKDGENEKSLDDLLEDLGGMGRFQIYLILGVCSSYMTLGWSLMLVSYSMADTKWHCATNVSTLTKYSMQEMNFLRNNRGSEEIHFQNVLNGVDLNMIKGNDVILGQDRSSCETVGNNSYKACTMGMMGRSCDSYCFDGDDVTGVTEWELVCDKEWLRQISLSLQMGGVLVGSFIFGQLSDSFGRKKTCYFAMLLHIVTNTVAGFSVSVEMYAASLFLLGISIGGFLTVIFPFVVEFLPSKWRPMASTLPLSSSGTCLMALTAYLFKNWTYLHFGVAIFGVLYLPGWFYFPESIRWLAVHQRRRQAMAAIEQIARVNKTQVPEYATVTLEMIDRSANDTGAEKTKYTYLDLFRSWRWCLRTLGLGFMWIVMNVAFYGLSLGVSSLSGIIYLNIFLMAIVTAPTNLSVLYFTNKVGRRYTAIISLALSTAVSLAFLIVEILMEEGSNRDTIITVLALAAKLTSSAAFAVIYIWGLELYPTVVRNIAFGMSSMLGRAGAVVSPFAFNLSSNAVVSLIILTSGMFVSTLIAIALPETKGVPLPDSLTEIVVEESEPEQDAKESSLLLPDSLKKVKYSAQ